MRSPWKLLALVEAIALIALFVLWPGSHPDSAPAHGPDAVVPGDVSTPSQVPGPPGTAESPGPEVITRASVQPEDEASEPHDGAGIVVYGTLTTKDGKPIEDGYLSLERDGIDPIRAPTDLSGNFAITGLEVGEYSLTLRAQGHLNRELPLAVQAAPEAQRKDFVMERAETYLVRLETTTGEELFAWFADQVEQSWRYRRTLGVVPTQEPVTSFPEHATRPPRTSHGYMAGRNDGTGRDLPSEYSGRLHLSSGLPMFATAVFKNIILGSIELEAGAESVTVYVDESKIFQSMGTVHLRVVDAQTGVPVTGARVEVTDGSWGGAGVQTGEDGRMSFEHVPPGTNRVEVYTENHAHLSSSFLLRAGQDRDLGDIRLSPSAGLTVHATLPDGKPAAAAPFCYIEPAQSWSTGVPRERNFTVDGDGQIELKRIPSGSFQVVAKETETTARQVFPVSTIAGETARLDVQLASGAEIVVKTNVSWTDGYRLVLTDASGQVYGPSLRAGSAKLRLLPGRYQLQASRPGEGTVATQDITVGHTPQVVDWTIP